MANRPVYIPNRQSIGVIVKDIDFKWHPGMSKQQKQKSIEELHNVAKELGVEPILEISSKSKDTNGVNLSAFNLMIGKQDNIFSVESAFQGSKVFEKGGPYIDLLSKPSIQAKKDPRLKESGGLLMFSFLGKDFPLKPKTFFYDWLYINALSNNKNLGDYLMSYNGFTDIEFNPKKSINCQAFSAALYVSLVSNSKIEEALQNRDGFLISTKGIYKEEHSPQGLFF